MKYLIERLKKYKAIPVFISIMLIFFRLFLYYAAKSKELYLEHDYMYSVINYIIISAALLIYISNKKVRRTYFIILIILALVNTAGIYKSISNVEFQQSFTNGKNLFIIKETKDEPEFSLVYVKKHKIFIRLGDKLKIKDGYKPFLNGKYKVIWLSGDKALVKFVYGSSYKAKGEILNFTIINGAYSNVLGGLQGTWTDKNNKENTLTFDRGQITYKTGTEIYWYSSSQADEQGNYGSILYGADGTPSLFVLKNDDNTMTVGYADLKK
ncbi:MAG: hypothetical protein LIR50_08755 [Bacillota bacterium]|nr:hypothetical protein [Bacillota bacterium]